ncbi:hypothetical protein T439DRAFT_327601 [Meredithblackwellia eburnea MCA 4105]
MILPRTASRLQPWLTNSIARAASTAPSPSPSRVGPSLNEWKSTIQSKRTTEYDTATLSRFKGLVSTIELPTDPPPKEWKNGSTLPPGYSLLLFRPLGIPLSTLNADGTEPGGPFHPPSPPPPAPPLERMWVAGSWEFTDAQPLRVGDKIYSVGKVEDVRERTGKDGRKGIYVTVGKEMGVVGQDGQRPPSLVERRTHLYRPPLSKSASNAATPPSPPPPRKDSSDFAVPFNSNSAMLFRFSALTFNTHRIHYDIEYCKEVEKRKGLVVHGPLTSLLLLSALRQNLPNENSFIKSFSYRATAPQTVGTPIWFCGKWSPGKKECEMWVEDADGVVYMTGRGVVRETENQ